MNIYKQKANWKIYLAIVGIIIVLLSLVYTNYVANKIADEERKKVEQWLLASERISTADLNCDLTLHQNILASNTTIPMILVSDAEVVIEGRNYGEENDISIPFLEKELKKIKASGTKPIEGFGNSIYYQESSLLTMLKYFPLFQFLLIVAFVGFGYLGFSTARRAEQNQVWVGMAKETAHQLGTPISAIVAWIEHLKLMLPEEDEDSREIIRELEKDVERLDLVADRFSKIGSAPKLIKINIFDRLNECRIYMQARAPRKMIFDFPTTDQDPIYVNINIHLFDWVVENLLRNALDAMDGTGEIKATVVKNGSFVDIDISDTGHGIPAGKLKMVFEPGFTTKKRGWGLGLSLAKRIIESYHSGKIFVKNSILDKGTTFSIKLPISDTSKSEDS